MRRFLRNGSREESTKMYSKSPPCGMKIIGKSGKRGNDKDDKNENEQDETNETKCQAGVEMYNKITPLTPVASNGPSDCMH
jgi:hypothetical protein